MVVDEVARRYGIDWALAPSQVPDAMVAKRFGQAGGAPPVLLVKPLTFMNRSGEAVAGLMRYYDLDARDMLVIVDEVALPFGRIRARANGSAGGHNGLKSLVAGLGTTAFPRLRLGVGRGDARRNLADHVLSKGAPGHPAGPHDLITRAADAAQMFAAEGIDKVMNAYNPDAAAPEVD
jgi:PTH1 family peptidyl-tRNA hydrolase